MSLTLTALSGAIDLATGWFENRKKRQSAQHDLEMARVNGQIQRETQLATATMDWDTEALRQTQYSWKDEYVVLVLTMPFIASFIPGLQDHVIVGWEYVSKAPEWYQWSFMGAIAASLGIRWAFNRKK